MSALRQSIEDRPYQNRVVSETLALLQRGKKGVIQEGPTGSGKTEMFTRVIRVMAQAGKCCAVFVHRDPLLKQASERLLRYGVPHGIIKPDHELCVGDTVHVASIDTVLARIDRPEYRRWLRSLDLAVFDEAHHCPADKWQRVMALIYGQFLGPTATPWRLDGKGLGDAGFDAVVRAPGVRQLIEMGYLAPFRVIAPPMPEFDRKSLSVMAGDYAQGDLQRMFDTAPRLAAMVRNYNRFAAGFPAFGFATGIDHAEHMAEAFRSFSWAAASVSGDTPEDDLDDALRKLGKNHLQMVASAQKLYEGTDVPAVTAVIDEALTASTQRYIQRVGRCFRLHEDKSEAIVLDLVGNSAMHGMPDADRPWSLEGGVKGLERQVEPTRRCIRCWRVHAWADRCIGCGAVYPKAKGEPVTVWHLPSVGKLRPEMVASKTVGEVVAMATTRRELEMIAQIKGIADHKWIDRAVSRSAIGRAAE